MEGGGTLEVKADGVRGVIKGKGVARGWDGQRDTRDEDERGEWTDG